MPSCKHKLGNFICHAVNMQVRGLYLKAACAVHIGSSTTIFFLAVFYFSGMYKEHSSIAARNNRC
jgi:hypothetical protein